MQKMQKILNVYIAAINKIDDHFEYANESKKDRAFIKQKLTELAGSLKQISDDYKEW